MNYIISWFYIEEEGNESSYLQVNAKSTSKKFQETYWKCILSFYYSSIKVNKGARHLFYTNSEHFPNIDGLDTKEFFKKNNIEVIIQDLSNKTPKDWHSAWRNQFYVFDILKHLSSQIEQDDSIVILDSDCIINNNLDVLFGDIRNNGAICYLIGYEENHIINGINTIQMKELYSEYYNLNGNVKYYGGEFIGIKGEYVQNVLEEYASLWEKNYVRYEKNKIKLNEEAHFLSIIYHRLNLANSLGNKYIKRIWNGLNYNNVIDNDNELSIYHLPSQKTTGFVYFYDKIVKKNKDYTLNEIVTIFDINSKKSSIRKIREILTKILFKYKK